MEKLVQRLTARSVSRRWHERDHAQADGAAQQQKNKEKRCKASRREIGERPAVFGRMPATPTVVADSGPQESGRHDPSHPGRENAQLSPDKVGRLPVRSPYDIGDAIIKGA